MALIDLYDGIAVVIDDEIHDSESGIGIIVKHLEDRNIPVVKYTELPNDEAIKHLHSASFIILDWELKPDLDLEDSEAMKVKIPGGFYEAQNLRFLGMVREISYCPIFIFTDQSVGNIKDCLHESKELADMGNHPIYVESKSNVLDPQKLFFEFERWLKEQPAAYALKMVNVEIQKTEVALYKKFLGISKIWPKVFWETSKKDETNPSLDLKNFILQYIDNTMRIPEFEEGIFEDSDGKESKITGRDLQAIYQGANLLQLTCKDREYPMTGDLFLVENQGSKPVYYINIRPLCDLLRGNDPLLYCLVGKEKKAHKISTNKGHILQITSTEIIPYVGKDGPVCFDFTNLEIRKWSELQDKLVGQVLPPLSLHIQQRYSQYLHRIGLPRAPEGYFKPEKVNEGEESDC